MKSGTFKSDISGTFVSDTSGTFGVIYSEEYFALKVIRVEADSSSAGKKGEVWYNVLLENGWIYRRTSKIPLDWEGKTKEFIVTTDVDENGNALKDKEGLKLH